MINRYIYRTVADGEPILLNSISGQSLPADADESTLRKHLFLEGQEQELLYARLLAPPLGGSFLVATTWECSLRCTHCSVLEKLKRKDDAEIDEEKFREFLEAYKNRYTTDKPPIAMIGFAGGEIGLRAEKSLSLLRIFKKCFDRQSTSTCTTNLFFPLTDDHLSLFSELDYFAVSVDGLEEDHNRQRKAFNFRPENPFQKTIANLEYFAEHHPEIMEKVQIQAAVKDEVYFDKAKRLAFYEKFLRMGIADNKISWGGLHPTKRSPDKTEVFKRAVARPVYRSMPCCKYRYMSRFQIEPDNKVYSDYLQTQYQDSLSYLGELGDDLGVMEERFKRLILQDMPALRDDKCMTCPVLGYCWGGCINGLTMIGDKPSLFCNQPGLIEKVNAAADAGTLLKASPHVCIADSVD
jgi:radical SAM protein with 4Fe4S-binding SPASM domain